MTRSELGPPSKRFGRLSARTLSTVRLGDCLHSTGRPETQWQAFVVHFGFARAAAAAVLSRHPSSGVKPVTQLRELKSRPASNRIGIVAAPRSSLFITLDD